MSFEDSDHALIKHFSNLEDPRDSTQVRHDLLDMIAHAIAAVIRGADDGVSIAAFARAKEEWLRKVLDLSNGIPSPDTSGGCSCCWHRRCSRSASELGGTLSAGPYRRKLSPSMASPCVARRIVGPAWDRYTW